MTDARLRADRSQVLLIDVQERLMPHILDGQQVVAQIVRLLRAAALLGVPVTVSEQYVRGLGSTIAPIRDLLGPAPRLEKQTFSCMGDETMRGAVESLGRPDVVLVGVEAHVCVQKTALDLLAAGRRPVIPVDAVGSRRALDRDTALARLAAAGAVLTTVESWIFELQDRCDTKVFKELLPLVRD